MANTTSKTMCPSYNGRPAAVMPCSTSTARLPLHPWPHQQTAFLLRPVRAAASPTTCTLPGRSARRSECAACRLVDRMGVSILRFSGLIWLGVHTLHCDYRKVHTCFTRTCSHMQNMRSTLSCMLMLPALLAAQTLSALYTNHLLTSKQKR